MTSDKAVRTITKALEVAEGLGQPAAKLVVAGGTYTENIIQISKKCVSIDLQGNTTIDGNFYVESSSHLEFTNDSYTLTVNGYIDVKTSSTVLFYTSSVLINGQLLAGSFSKIYSECELSVVVSNRVAIGVYESSTIMTNSAVSVTTSNSTSDCVVVHVNSLFRPSIITVNATNCSGWIFHIENSSFLWVTELTITGSNNSGGGINVLRHSQILASNVSIDTDVIDNTAFSIGFHSFGYFSGANFVFCSGKFPFYIATGSTVRVSGDLSIRGGSKVANQNMIFVTDGSIFVHYSGNLSITSDTNTASHAIRSVGNSLVSLTLTKLTVVGKYTIIANATINSSIYYDNSGTSAGTSITGKRYSADRGGQIYVGGAGANRFPGSTAGTPTATDSTTLAYYG